MCCRIVLPCLSKTVSHTCQSGRPLGSSCGAMQTSDTDGPRSLPQTGNRHTSKIGPTGSTRAQESCETVEIVANGVSSGGLMQTKRSVTVDRDVDLCSPQHSVLSFVLCFCSPMSLKLLISWVMSLLIGAVGSCACLSFVFGAAVRDYWARVATRKLFGAIDSCVLFFLVYSGFLDLGVQRVLLVVGTCRARLLHNSVVSFSLVSTRRSGQASKAPLC